MSILGNMIKDIEEGKKPQNSAVQRENKKYKGPDWAIRADDMTTGRKADVSKTVMHIEATPEKEKKVKVANTLDADLTAYLKYAVDKKTDIEGVNKNITPPKAQFMAAPEKSVWEKIVDGVDAFLTEYLPSGSNAAKMHEKNKGYATNKGSWTEDQLAQIAINALQNSDSVDSRNYAMVDEAYERLSASDRYKDSDIVPALREAKKSWAVSPGEALGKNVKAAVVGMGADVASFANSLGVNKIPGVGQLTDAAVRSGQIARAEAARYNKGGYGETVGNFTQGVVNLVPYFLMGPGKGVADAALKTTKYSKYLAPIVKNPSFWYSLTSMWGGKYQEAIDSGASEQTALTNAMLYAVPAALVEVGGGIGSQDMGTQKLSQTILEEIGEELAQDVIGGMSDKATSNPELPYWSTEESAVINPVNMAKTALMTAPIVAVAGGANRVVNKAAMSYGKKQNESKANKVVDEYKNSVDEKILQFAKFARANKNDNTSKISLQRVSDSAVNDIKNLTGIDVSGYTHSLKANTIHHIDKKHGVNGKTDNSMADDKDLARIQYVLDNYDSMEVLPDLSAEYRTKNQEKAPMIKYTKRVNGSYYVVEAVPDTKRQELPIVSVYKNKAVEQRTVDVQAPTSNVQNASADTTLSDNNVSQNGNSVNTQYVRNAGNNTALAERLEEQSKVNEPLSVEDVKKATGFGEEGSKLVVRLANSQGITFRQAEKAVKIAYNAGFTDLKATKVNFDNNLQKAAFDAGKIDRGVQDRVAQANAKHATIYDGVFTENEHTKNLTRTERKMISIFAEGLAMDISTVDEIIASETLVDGKKIKHYANASHKDGKMQISSDVGRILYKMVMHEGGHRMKQLAPDKFGVLMNALYKRAVRRSAESGVSQSLIFDNVKAEHDNAGLTMDTSGYFEEFAVRELETIFSSAREFNKWYAEISGNWQLRNSFERFIDWVLEVIDDIKRAFKYSKMSTEEKAEARRVLAELEHIKDLYAKVWRAAENAVAERKSELQSDNVHNFEKDAQKEKVGGTGTIKYSVKFDFGNQVDAALDNNLKRGYSVYVGKTPNLIVKCGVNPDLPMLMNPSHLKDINHTKDPKNIHWHGLTRTQIKQIPNEIKNPVIIFDSISENKENSICVVTKLKDADGLPVIISLRANSEQSNKYYDVNLETIKVDKSNFVTSAYGKDNFRTYIEEVLNQDALLYANKEKTLKLFSDSGLQLPTRLNNLGFDKIIHQSRNIVNTYSMQKAEINSTKNLEIKANEGYNANISHSLKSSYNEYQTNALIWARATDRQPGDLNILNANGKYFALIEATEDGFIELKKGTYKEVQAEYERAYRKANNEIYGNLESYESDRGTDIWDMQFYGKGRDGNGNTQQIESQGLQNNSTRDNEYLRSGDKGEYERLEDYSLKSGVSATELLDTIDDMRNGKKKAVSTLSEYVERGAISPEFYDELIEKYGSIPSGEKPHRDIQVPKKTAKDKKVSQTVRTILEAKVTPDEAVPAIEELVAKGEFSYDTYTDKAAIAEAEKNIKKKGWETAKADWYKSVGKGEVSKKNTAEGWVIYNNAVNSGETETALEVLNFMVKHQRSAAQALQATRILKKLSPETQLYGVQKSVQALQEELSDKYGKKAPNIKIDESLAEQFLKAETQEERTAVEKEIYKDIGRQMPATFADKWNAWRYLAMLGNLRTHIRNVVGNAGFAPIVIAKNMTATAIEMVVNRVSGKKIVRGKSLITGNKADRALLKAAWSDYGNVADIVSNGGKYNDFAMANQYIEEGRKIFKSKTLEWARKKNSQLLEAEDMWFAKPHYAYALAQYCKANNITAEQINKGRAIEPARAYAIKEAQKATYRDTNAFSQMVSEWGRTNKNEKNVVKKAFNATIEGNLPFRKTPANILVRGVEYSPAGLLKGLSYDLVQVSKGEMSATEAIDNISAGLTGTGLLALGVFLAAQGLIRGRGKDDEAEKEFKELMGHQAYALELPNGKSITLDWLAPEALPFFIGVNIWETTRGTDKEVSLSVILQAVKGISEPMLEMSCLQGLNDLFENVRYARENEMSGLTAALSTAATNYLTQGLPTLLGQAERTGEENRMTTYTEKNAFLTRDMQYTLGKASAKIPFADYHQIPYIDAWGRKEASGTALKRGLNNFLNPAYQSTIDTSDMENELLRLYEKTGDDGVFPERADKYFTVDGVRKDLTAEEYVRYATLKGEKSYKAVSDLVKSKAYKKLTDQGKAKAVKEVYDYANKKAKQAISNYKPDSWVKKADEFGSNVGSYISFKTEVSNTKEENGGKISKTEVADIILDMAQNDSETWKMYLSMYDSDKDMYAYNKGIDGETYMYFLESLNDVDRPTESGKYGTYTQEEAYRAIRQLEGLSQKEKAILWQSVNTSWKASKNPFR